MFAEYFEVCVDPMCDIVVFIQVEQRRKEALARTSEDGASALENSLQDIVSRYNFMDLWPCSSKELDHLSRQDVQFSF